MKKPLEDVRTSEQLREARERAVENWKRQEELSRRSLNPDRDLSWENFPDFKESEYD